MKDTAAQPYAEGARQDVRVHRLAQVAEPDTLVVRMEIADRDALIADDPHTST